MIMSLNEVLRMYIWLKDQGTFFYLPQKRNVPETAVIKRLSALKMEAAKIAEVIQSMKDTGINKASLKPQRPKVTELIGGVYDRVKGKLPMLRLSSKGINLLFQVDRNSQVAQCGELDRDKFVNIIVATPTALEAIKHEHSEGESAEAFRGLTLKAFAETLYDHFLMDPEKVLTEEPALLSWTPLKPAYRVLNPAILVPGPTPNWDSFLARMDFPETFKAYVWSAFEPRNTGRQALWLRGEGSDGKSSAINAVVAFLGRPYVLSIGKGSYDSDFFFGAAFGKRLAIYMDCKNTYILKSERIKSLLGRDTVNINQKHEREFSAQVYSKLIVASNFHPKINYNDNSERTRLLLCEVATYKDEFGDPDFEYNLEREFPAFLVQCQAAYEAQCPNNVNLRIPKSMVHKIKAACSSKEAELMDRFIEQHLEFGPDFKIPKIELYNRLVDYLHVANLKGKLDFIEDDFGRLLALKGASTSVHGATTYYNGLRINLGTINYKPKIGEVV